MLSKLLANGTAGTFLYLMSLISPFETHAMRQEMSGFAMQKRSLSIIHDHEVCSTKILFTHYEKDRLFKNYPVGKRGWDEFFYGVRQSMANIRVLL